MSNPDPISARIAKATRIRSGSPKAAKTLSWRMVKRIMHDFESTNDVDTRIRCGHLLTQALGVHGRLCETSDLADRLKIIERQLAEEQNAT